MVLMMELTEGARLLRWAVDPANENRAMTQADLARILEVSAPTVHDWIRGAKRPRAERREAIRAVLAPYGVDVPVAAWLTSAERGEPSELDGLTDSED
jgi:transcriptional regulator with XRE-family HTH domain